MADIKPQSPLTPERRDAASSMPADVYESLVKALEDVSKDPALVRRLVYAMAWHNIKPDDVISKLLPVPLEQARSATELQKILQFESAVERLETDFAQAGPNPKNRESQSESKRVVELRNYNASPATSDLSNRERAPVVEHAKSANDFNNPATTENPDDNGNAPIANQKKPTATTNPNWADTILRLKHAIQLKRSLEGMGRASLLKDKRIFELEGTLELERAIERLATDAARHAKASTEPQPQADLVQAIARVEAEAVRSSHAIRSLERTLELKRALEQLQADDPQMHQYLTGIHSHFSPAPTSEASLQPADNRAPSANLPSAEQSSVRQEVSSQPMPQTSSAETIEALPEEPPSHTAAPDNAVVMLPERPPVWLQRTEPIYLDRSPPWHNHPIHLSVEMAGDARNRPSHWRPNGIFTFLQLVAASVLGVALYVGVAGWLQSERPMHSNPEPATAAPPPVAAAPAIAPMVSDTASEATPPAMLRSAARQDLPFPLPRTYGVYAGNSGQLTELEPLPIRIPDHRIQLSAEIRSPSKATVADGRLSFVVFRRDLLNRAPQTVSVRVVAQVARTMRFVDGKAVYRTIDGVWRIRSNAYELKVSPIEGHPEMILIQPEPGFVFPAGRYALVLNGNGYDFTVPGQISTPEQCLEQAAMQNGTVLSECSRS